MAIENKELIEKAKELAIKVEDFEDEKDLQEEVDKKTSVSDTDTVETLKSKVAFLQKDAKKAYEKRDRVAGDARTYKTKLTDLEKKLEGAVSKEEVEALQKELKDLKTFKETIEKKEQDKELESKSELEKTKIKFQREFDDLQKKMEAAIGNYNKELDKTKEVLASKDNEITALRRIRLKTELMEQASKLKAYNPTQVAKLLMGDFEYDKDDDVFVMYRKDSKGKTEAVYVDEYVKEFLEDPDNDNLVESTVRDGSGGDLEDKSKGKQKTGTITTESGKKYVLNDPELIAKAEEARLPVEGYIKMAEKRDAKLKKMREKK